MNRTLLAKNAEVLVTMDSERRELRGGALYVEGNVIKAVGPAASLPATADEVIDLAHCVVVPGLVNTHHHMVQTLTRAVPSAQNAELFGWLGALYPLWEHLTPEMIHVATLTAMAELLLSGCTTSSDHLYIYPNGARLEDSLEAAERIGMRFHASRGAMRRIVVAPCSPFTVTQDLMREAASLARAYGVSLHTHLAENENDVAYSLER